METDVMRIALTGQRLHLGVREFYGVVVNEQAAEVWTGPGRATRVLAQTDANSAAESLTMPEPWAARMRTGRQ
jgi:hypothetical protein